MNDPVQTLAQMAMNRIASDPRMKNNPQAREFMSIMQSGDVTRGEEMARNLCNSYGITQQQALQQAKSFFRIP